jgi:hypothetical protein
MFSGACGLPLNSKSNLSPNAGQVTTSKTIDKRIGKDLKNRMVTSE